MKVSTPRSSQLAAKLSQSRSPAASNIRHIAEAGTCAKPRSAIGREMLSRSSIPLLPAGAEPPFQEVAYVQRAAVRHGVADIVRQAVIDLELGIGERSERVVIGERTDRLGAGNDDQGRAG